MITAIGILLLLAIYLLSQEALRRNKRLSWVTFLILPFVLLPWWIAHEEHSLFGWLKIYSISLSVSWALGVRFTALKEKKWAYVVIYVLLLLNIFEAVVLDIAEGHLLNYLNAIAGVLLIVTMPRAHTIRVDETGPYRDLLCKPRSTLGCTQSF